MLLAGAVAGDSANNLDDLGEGRPVADGEGVLGEGPVEPFLGHPERDDDVHSVAVYGGDRREVVQGVRALLLVRVVDEIGDLEELSGVVATNTDNPGIGVRALDV